MKDTVIYELTSRLTIRVPGRECDKIFRGRSPYISEQHTKDWDTRSNHRDAGFRNIPYDEVGSVDWNSVRS